jgi:ribosomal protein S18 acetylase RimI-like enzyme
MGVALRAATEADIPAVLALWQDSAEPTSTDSPEALAVLLGRDPGALMVAETDGEIVGSVVAAWDGWRGSVYRLAVNEEHRRAGLGRALLLEAELRLARLGAQRLHAIVMGENAAAVRFWEASDWERHEGASRYTKGVRR